MSVALIHPCPTGHTTDAFGWRAAIPGVVSAQLHTGQDYAAPIRTPVFAAHAGTVRRLWWDTWDNGVAAGGNMIQISAAQHATRYAHLDGYAVKLGDTVKAGQLIGWVGQTGAATGPHLHFEYLLNGNFVDPVPYITATPTLTESETDMHYLVLQKKHTYLITAQGRAILLGTEGAGTNMDPRLPVIHAHSAGFTMTDLKAAYKGIRSGHLTPVK